ncbi:restriction endonuclease subunit S [Priestia aryabhattai]|nr:restriction endonuclease subunit S [Priestia aryabhattai]
MFKSPGSLLTYENYRDSGVECYGSVPAHWKTLANKYIFDLKKNLVGRNSSRYTLLSLTLGGIIKRDMENPEGKFPADFNTYQKVTPGDFVFCLFDVEETPRTIGLSSLHGMITGAYTVFRPRKKFDEEYLQYLYLSLDSGKRLRFLYKGLRNTIPKEVFLAFKSLNPPIQEQKLISRFLSVKTAQIDQAIQTKERQIELIKERKQILIQQVVTRGLNPQAPMRKSDIEWIGEIPAHWETVRLKYLFKETNERSKTGEETLLSLRMELGLVPHDDVSDKAISNESLVDYKIVRPGQMVMNRMRAAIGIFGVSFRIGLVSPDYTVFDINERANSSFFLRLFKLPLLGTQFRLGSKGLGTGSSGFMRLYTEEFGNIKVAVPPLGEQLEILHFIDSTSERMDNACILFEQQITKLKEYKVTLINSAVTGKIKVPGVVEPDSGERLPMLAG